MKLDPVGRDSRLAVQEVKERDARDACVSADARDTPGRPTCVRTSAGSRASKRMGQALGGLPEWGRYAGSPGSVWPLCSALPSGPGAPDRRLSAEKARDAQHERHPTGTPIVSGTWA